MRSVAADSCAADGEPQNGHVSSTFPRKHLKNYWEPGMVAAHPSSPEPQACSLTREGAPPRIEKVRGWGRSFPHLPKKFLLCGSVSEG